MTSINRSIMVSFLFPLIISVICVASCPSFLRMTEVARLCSILRRNGPFSSTMPGAALHLPRRPVCARAQDAACLTAASRSGLHHRQSPFRPRISQGSFPLPPARRDAALSLDPQTCTRSSRRPVVLGTRASSHGSSLLWGGGLGVLGGGGTASRWGACQGRLLHPGNVLNNSLTALTRRGCSSAATQRTRARYCQDGFAKKDLSKCFLSILEG